MDIVISYPNQVLVSLFFAFLFGIMVTLKPAFGFYAVCLFLPAYILRIRGTAAPTNVLELLIVMTVLGWLGYSLGHKIKIYLPDKHFLVGAILIVMGAFISLAVSKNEFFLQGAGTFKGFLVEPIIFSIALYSAIRQKLVNEENIIKILFWSASIVAIVSLIGGFIPSLEFWTYDSRLRGFYLSPNHLAMYLAPITPLVFWKIISKFKISNIKKQSTDNFQASIFNKQKRLEFGFWKSNFVWLLFLVSWLFKKTRIFGGAVIYCFLASLILLALFLTKSFGAWLALVVAAVIAVIIWRKRLNPKIIKVMVAGGLILSLILGFLLREELASFLLNPERSSWASRFQIWGAALAILKDNPLLGIGLGTFQEYYLAYQKYFMPYLEWAVPQPHNLILAFWLQTGIIGLAGFLWLVTNFFARAYKTLKKIPLQKFEAGQAAIICAVIIVLVQGLIDTTIWKNDLAALFFILIIL